MMIHHRWAYGVLLCVAAPQAFLTGAVSGAVPTEINHQGVVTVSGQRFTGDGDFYFAIIDPTTGNSVWTNDGTNIGTANRPLQPVTLACANGLYSVGLGDTTLTNMTPVTADVFSTENRSLRIWFNDGMNGVFQLTPDHALTSVPYAFRQETSVNPGGISFGDGSDGDVVINSNTTLTADKYYVAVHGFTARKAELMVWVGRGSMR